jgi:hypothetical protein
MSEISDFSGNNHFLSNFHPSPVMLDGKMYPTVEHAYQAAKTLDQEDRDVIRTCGGPAIAKKLGRHAKIREDWNDVKISVMTELVYQKFQNDQALACKLMDTKNAVLVEGNWWGDTFWGVCKGTGSNHLGKILMAVRRAIVEDQNEHRAA